MPIPRFEVPAGAVDGANTVYTTSVPYQAGSTAVFLNGLLLRPDLTDGWVETDPATGAITLNEAPRSTGACPDVLQVFYLDLSPALPEEVITEIRATLDSGSGEPLEGRLYVDEPLRGVVDPLEGLDGVVSLQALIRASIDAETALTGTLRECE